MRFGLTIVANWRLIGDPVFLFSLFLNERGDSVIEFRSKGDFSSSNILIALLEQDTDKNCDILRVARPYGHSFVGDTIVNGRLDNTNKSVIE